MIIDITLNLAYILIFAILALFLFLLHNYGGVKLFVKKDESIAHKFLDKYPLVSNNFISKTAKEQNIENNQEIHEINKRFENLERLVQEVIKKCK